MAWVGRSSGPHGSGAELEEFRGWRAFLHLARELQLARLASFVVPYRRRAILAVLAMVVFTMTSLSIPYLVKVAIDSGIQRRDLHVVTVVIVVFLGVNVVNVLAGYLQTYFVSWVGERMLLDLRRALFAHIQKLSLDFFSRQKTGWIVSRLTNDIDAIDQLVTDGVTSLVTNLLTLIGAAVLLLALDWRLALATLSIMPVLLAATLVFRTHSARSYAKVRDRIANVSAHLQESISGIHVITAFRREEADYAILDRRNAEYRDANMETVVQSGIYFPFVQFLAAAATVVVLWYGGSLVAGQALPLGVLVAFIGYINSFFDPVQQLSQLYNTFQASMAAVRKIYTVLDTDPDLKDAPDAEPLPDVSGELEFRHVTFSYDGTHDVVHDVELHGAARRNGRFGRPDRRGEEHADQAPGSFLRPERRRGADRRARPDAGDDSGRCEGRWRSCRRRRSCSAARSWTTSASDARRRAPTRSAGWRASSAPTTSSRPSRTATTRMSRRAAQASRPDSGS